MSASRCGFNAAGQSGWLFTRGIGRFFQQRRQRPSTSLAGRVFDCIQALFGRGEPTIRGRHIAMMSRAVVREMPCRTSGKPARGRSTDAASSEPLSPPHRAAPTYQARSVRVEERRWTFTTIGAAAVDATPTLGRRSTGFAPRDRLSAAATLAAILFPAATREGGTRCLPGCRRGGPRCDLHRASRGGADSSDGDPSNQHDHQVPRAQALRRAHLSDERSPRRPSQSRLRCGRGRPFPRLCPH